MADRRLSICLETTTGTWKMRPAPPLPYLPGLVLECVAPGSMKARRRQHHYAWHSGQGALSLPPQGQALTEGRDRHPVLDQDRSFVETDWNRANGRLNWAALFSLSSAL